MAAYKTILFLIFVISFDSDSSKSSFFLNIIINRRSNSICKYLQIITRIDKKVINNNSCILLLTIDTNKGHDEFFLFFFLAKLLSLSSLLKYSSYIV